MKFLCGNCKAKYQIADAKVQGRTLRMKCRRCGHDILIQGGQVAGAASAPASAIGGSTVSLPPSSPRTGRSVVPVAPPLQGPGAAQPPTALGAGFRRGLAARPEVPRRNAALDQWHVAINDVAVGPMTREELARKVSAGAVGTDSLCWREGMDDWRPLSELAELGTLSAVEAGASTTMSRRPGAIDGRLAQGAVAGADDFDDEFGEPTRVADIAHLPPIRAHGGDPASASPKSMPQLAPVVDGAPQRSSQQINWNHVLLGMGLMCVVLTPYLLLTRPDPAPPAAKAAVAPAEERPAAAPAPVAVDDTPDMDFELEDEEESELAAAGEAEHEPARAAHAGSRAGSKRSAGAQQGKKLSAAEQALLARMGGAGSGGTQLGKRRAARGGAGGGGGTGLNAAQLRVVVTRGRPQLQRCYETALRSSGSTDTIKIQVSVTIGLSGTVTAVDAKGNGVGGLNRCIERTVKRWRFPSASDSTKTAFPVVFQPGS